MQQGGDSAEDQCCRACKQDAGHDRATERIRDAARQYRKLAHHNERKCRGDPDTDQERAHDREGLKDFDESAMEGEDPCGHDEHERNAERRSCGERCGGGVRRINGGVGDCRAQNLSDDDCGEQKGDGSKVAEDGTSATNIVLAACRCARDAEAGEEEECNRRNAGWNRQREINRGDTEQRNLPHGAGSTPLTSADDHCEDDAAQQHQQATRLRRVDGDLANLEC